MDDCESQGNVQGSPVERRSGRECWSVNDTDGDVRLEKRTTSLGFQIFPPFLLAGFGTVAAGVFLDIVQHWQVFEEITELYILIPALLGLKGNLEMTLASRLSTQANLGLMESSAEALKLCLASLALVQVQALVVALLASVLAIVFAFLGGDSLSLWNVIVLLSSALSTAFLASVVLGALVCLVVHTSHRFHLNPDNIAAPLAASVGDVSTLLLLSVFAHTLHTQGTLVWLTPLVTVVAVLTAPFSLMTAQQNMLTAGILHTGWTPVLCAMCISSVGGFILDKAIMAYEGIAVFSPVINGVGGNLVAVQASRLSTSFHQHGRPGETAAHAYHRGIHWPFLGGTSQAHTSRVLLTILLPGSTAFLLTIAWLRAGHNHLSFAFFLMYMSAAYLQVVTLLALAAWLVGYLWHQGKDPDNHAIPYLTACGDVLGTGLLAVGFCVVHSFDPGKQP